MTDKIQKIREEVARLQKRAEHLLDISLTENEREYWLGESNVLTLVGKYIDTMQEEPVSIWHDASEKPNIKEKGSIFVITSLNGEYIGSRYYNYNDITINFGNYDKWAYLNDLVNLSNVQRTTKDWKEEPVSEDLEEACEQLAENARKHKAETSSPFFSPTDYKQGVMDGAKWQKEQMMAKAIDATCFGFQGAALFSFRLPASSYLVGSKVKVIVIKED